MFRQAAVATALVLVSGFAAVQGPQRPKIYGVAFVRLKSSDFSKASETYSKILGLGTDTSESTNGCSQVKNPCFVVNASQHLELVAAQPRDSGSWLDEIAFATSRVSSMRDYLLHHGVGVSELKTAPGGNPFIETQDPEGNRIAFVERNPHGSFSPGPHQVSSFLVHAGFVAKDLRVMNKFYLDTLGFRL
jgi:hypothetical protein